VRPPAGSIIAEAVALRIFTGEPARELCVTPPGALDLELAIYATEPAFVTVRSETAVYIRRAWVSEAMIIAKARVRPNERLTVRAEAMNDGRGAELDVSASITRVQPEPSAVEKLGDLV